MEIRRAQMKDLEEIMRIYSCARAFMRKNGNPSQWNAHYPSIEMIEQDIKNNVSYVCEEEGRTVAVFAFIIGEDPTYKVIEQGAWMNEEPYGTIHRIASDGSVRGVMGKCLEFCEERCGNIRIDTHMDNVIMRHLFEKNGFTYCGVIYAADKTPRMAYQKLSGNVDIGNTRD